MGRNLEPVAWGGGREGSVCGGEGGMIRALQWNEMTFCVNISKKATISKSNSILMHFFSK